MSIFAYLWKVCCRHKKCSVVCSLVGGLNFVRPYRSFSFLCWVQVGTKLQHVVVFEGPDDFKHLNIKFQNEHWYEFVRSTARLVHL